MKKELSKPNKYRREALKMIVAILKHEYSELKDAGMTGQYKEGYYMGFSDAIETIQDINLTPPSHRGIK